MYMKKNYLLTLLALLLVNLCSFRAQAQTLPPDAEISTAYYDRMNYIFSPLEKQRVPYGLLRQ